MSEFTEEQKSYIAKLEDYDKSFAEILAKDPNGMIIPFGNERDELDGLRQRTQKVLHKLKTHEFTVAVVGLEKAGKSTFGNALLKKNILPEYTERCTFTTTKICAGSEDYGKIFFYSKEKFKANFADTLKNILGCPKELVVDFETMDLGTFNRWWASMADENPIIFDKHNTTTAEDIKIMLRDRRIILGLLSQKPKEFFGDELESDNFKIFITGYSGVTNGVKIRSAHPYAVEKVIIQSSSLGEMKDIVLYDVPGFNSPTDLHEKQTLEMLGEADAVILATNISSNPNLDGQQLRILKKGSSKDDVPLSDKSFIFGTQIDRLDNAELAKRSGDVLKSEVTSKYRIAKEHHVFFGSAKAYLEHLGIESSDELLKGSTAARDKMDAWGMPYGIAELWEGMKEYYNNDRFEVLRRRAESTIADAINFLDGILKKYESAEWQPIETGGRLYIEAMRDLSTFKKAVYDIAESHNARILSEKPFSQKLRDEITEFFPDQTAESPTFKEVKSSGNIAGSGPRALTEIDALFRAELQRQFLRNLVQEMAKVTEEEERQIYAEIIKKFLEVMGMSENSPYKEELTKSVEDLFNALWINGADKCRFNSLIERFTSHLLEVLIWRPFGSSERYQEIADEEYFPEFLSLATYYEHSPDAAKDNGDDRVTEFFSKILLHENISTGTDWKNSLEKFFKENKDTINSGLSFAIEALPFGKWAKLLLREGIKVNGIPEDLQKKLRGAFYRSDWGSLSKDERIGRLTDTINDYLRSKSDFSGNITTEKLHKMYELSRQVEITSEEVMLEILNEDIKILREFMLEAVIYAIGLEQAFVSVITKNINIVRKDEDTPEGQELFDKWVENNIRKLRDDQFKRIDQTNLDNQTKQNIVESIRKVLNGME